MMKVYSTIVEFLPSSIHNVWEMRNVYNNINKDKRQKRQKLRQRQPKPSNNLKKNYNHNHNPYYNINWFLLLLTNTIILIVSIFWIFFIINWWLHIMRHKDDDKVDNNNNKSSQIFSFGYYYLFPSNFIIILNQIRLILNLDDYDDDIDHNLTSLIFISMLGSMNLCFFTIFFLIFGFCCEFGLSSSSSSSSSLSASPLLLAYSFAMFLMASWACYYFIYVLKLSSSCSVTFPETISKTIEHKFCTGFRFALSAYQTDYRYLRTLHYVQLYFQCCGWSNEIDMINNIDKDIKFDNGSIEIIMINGYRLLSDREKSLPLSCCLIAESKFLHKKSNSTLSPSSLAILNSSIYWRKFCSLQEFLKKIPIKNKNIDNKKRNKNFILLPILSCKHSFDSLIIELCSWTRFVLINLIVILLFNSFDTFFLAYYSQSLS